MFLVYHRKFTFCMKERLNASLSCLMWQRVFYNTSVRSHLQVEGDTMCEYRYVISMKDYEVDKEFCTPVIFQIPWSFVVNLRVN